VKTYIFNLLLLSSLYAHGAQYTVYAHGIIDGPAQINRFKDVIATPLVAPVTFPDAQIISGWNLNGIIGQLSSLYGQKVNSTNSFYGKHINRNAMYMGQEADLEAISATIAQVPTQESMILYGCSRGAAALLTYLGKYNPSNIAALVLDACPADLPATLHIKLASCGIHPTWANTIFTTLFPQYDSSTAITPFNAIALIQNKDLPILLIHSKKDHVVPYIHSLQLYQQLLDHGFTNVHLILVPHGRHAYILQDEPVAPLYAQAVHSFYKKYNLPYDATIAQDTMQETMLTKEEIEQKTAAYQESIQNVLYAKRAIYSAVIAITIMLLYEAKQRSLE